MFNDLLLNYFLCTKLLLNIGFLRTFAWRIILCFTRFMSNKFLIKKNYFKPIY